MHDQRQSIFIHQRSQEGLAGIAEKPDEEYIPPFLLGLATRSEIPHEIGVETDTKWMPRHI